MSNSVNPALASLQDIQTPTEVGTWPFAYGYWLTLTLLIVCVALLFVWFRKRQQRLAPKKAALNELAAMSPSSEHFVVEVSSLLKRAAMSYTSRTDIAKLSGDKWGQWLSAQVTKPQDELAQLLAARFQPQQLTEADKQRLKSCAQNWLKQALPLKPNHDQDANREVSKC
ncbi:hypothetical protein TUM4438_15500 [Shewanella sairae]|uniref:DUF4381 domain-containing protein n=1 Tax=Shewanella sairae TaxID=190310 RepID=A0ABQ4PAH8_9GAMM|nr:DUF4381 domain-containing protein [Shewanella sairae]MCL1128226.1 DUF4381 domain-containing protein [Shewanella sairae]GIU44399.1 hypothetical protein TUM4438_15500 [Shewanella sairae]